MLSNEGSLSTLLMFKFPSSGKIMAYMHNLAIEGPAMDLFIVTVRSIHVYHYFLNYFHMRVA